MPKPKLLGDWVKSCNVYHLMPNTKLSWNDARAYCCGLGLKLVSLYSHEKQLCLNDVLNKKPDISFWTSGTDNSCTGSYRWCSGEVLDFLKPDLLWLKSEPKGDSCVFVQYKEDFGALLGTIDCQEELNFICETRPGSEYVLDPIVKECQAVNKLSSREIKMFSNEYYSRFTYRMKCHMSCVLQLTTLMYNEEHFWVDNVMKYIRGSLLKEIFPRESVGYDPANILSINDERADRFGGVDNFLSMFAILYLFLDQFLDSYYQLKTSDPSWSLFSNDDGISLQYGVFECQNINGTLPIAVSFEQFEHYFYVMNGTNSNLLWDEAYVADDGELRWCREPNISIPAPLQSGLDIVKEYPFFLVSLAGSKPNFHAVHLDSKFYVLRNCQLNTQFAQICINTREYQNYVWE
ncbi:uncharacterized protein LOC135937519 [Cloeon dipterum]|uniref:uncharacterized protein LOC135937519 n=1 Tax=Cloeon dipterum TaxID=197152 RepID=UPI00321FE5F8